MTAIRLLVGS